MTTPAATQTAPASPQEARALARALAAIRFPDRRRFEYRRCYRGFACPTRPGDWGGMIDGGVRHA